MSHRMFSQFLRLVPKINQAILLNLAINDTTSDQLKLQASIFILLNVTKTDSRNQSIFAPTACSAYSRVSLI